MQTLWGYYYEDEELSCLGPWKLGEVQLSLAQQEDMRQGQGPARVEGYNTIPLSPKPISASQETLTYNTSWQKKVSSEQQPEFQVLGNLEHHQGFGFREAYNTDYLKVLGY